MNNLRREFEWMSKARTLRGYRRRYRLLRLHWWVADKLAWIADKLGV